MALAQSYLGTSTVGTSSLAVAAGTMYLKKITLAAGDFLAAVEIYLNTDAAATVNLKPVLYNDNAGVPGKIIALQDSQDGTLRFTATPRWLSLPVGFQSAAGEDVWVGFHSSYPASMTLAYETSGGDDRQVTGSWTVDVGTYGTAVDPGSHLYSIRASVITGMTATRPGRTSVGGSWLTFTFGPVLLQSIAVPANSVLASVAGYVQQTVANVVTMGAHVWDDNAGVPGKLRFIGQPADGNNLIMMPAVGRWLHFPVGLWNPSAATLWVGLQMLGGASFQLAYDTTGGDGGSKAGAADANVWTSGTNSYSLHGLVLT